MARIGKRERQAIRSLKQARASKVRANCANLEALALARKEARSCYMSGAYSFKGKPERHTRYGNVRVMHNVKGSEPIKSPFKRRWAKD
jgi:hypothetical protein